MARPNASFCNERFSIGQQPYQKFTIMLLKMDAHPTDTRFWGVVNYM
jgi:hypothetical protein